MVLSLEARKIPPNINFETPNPLSTLSQTKSTTEKNPGIDDSN